MSAPTPKSKRVQDVATRLFNENGYHQTGVDLIMRESGVSKTTLYKHYRTKEDLVIAMLKDRSASIFADMEARIETYRSQTDHPTDVGQLNAMIDALEQWIGSSTFYGCNFIRAISEYENSNSQIVETARAHKNKIKHLIASSLRSLAPANVEPVAEQIMFIFDGAIVAAHTRGRTDAISNARDLIEKILASSE